MYFKSDYHEELYNRYISSFRHRESNVLGFSYLLSSVEKDFTKEVNEDGIKASKIVKDAKSFSSSEKLLIDAAVNCFNSEHKMNLKAMTEVFDSTNMRVLRQYLELIM